MKKKILAIVLAALICMAVTVFALHAQDTVVSLDAKTKEDTVRVRVVLHAEDVSGFSFNLQYDESLFSFVEYTKHSALGGTSFFVNENYSSGEIRVVMASVNGIHFDGEVLEFTFRKARAEYGNAEFCLAKGKMETVDGEKSSFENVKVSIASTEETTVPETTVPETTIPETTDPQTGAIGGGTPSASTPKEPAKTTATAATAQEPFADVPEASTVTFVDVPAEAWYYSYVHKIVARKLFSGTSENEFSPDAQMTRAMLVTVLHRLDGTPKKESAQNFADVLSGQWYSDAVAWASANGIVNGYDENTFGANDAITRQDMVTVLYRYMQYKNITTEGAKSIEVFDDVTEVSAYAEDAVQWAYGTGLVKGTSETTLSPKSNTTRAQVATIILRYMENVSR